MLPDSWVAKIFDHMAALYGSKFSALWKGSDMQAVRRVWADKLGGFQDKPEAIRQALNGLDERPFPPTLPEFIADCREAAKRLQSNTQALPHKMTEEEIERAEQAAKKAKDATKSLGERDHLLWAKRPASKLAMASVLTEAKRDGRFREILADLKRSGVVSEQGELLKRGDAINGQWVMQ